MALGSVWLWVRYGSGFGMALGSVWLWMLNESGCAVALDVVWNWMLNGSPELRVCQCREERRARSEVEEG